MLTRTAQGWACGLNCVNGVTRTVWDGDQVVAEIRAPMVNPERDSGIEPNASVNDQALYGRVLYTHGGALDRPLSMVRLDYSDLFPEPHAILPHTNNAGSYDIGTFASAGRAEGPCVKMPLTETDVPLPPGREEEGGTNQSALMDSVTICVEVPWPAPYQWKTHQVRPRTIPSSWMGSLIQGSRDATGQMYMRNRYYDPNTGRFTQEDPIGIAGGLNVYGFANGDPVSYSDPYGLCPDPVKLAQSGLPAGLSCPEDLTIAVLGFLLDGPRSAMTVVNAGVDWLSSRFARESTDDPNRAAGPMMRPSRRPGLHGNSHATTRRAQGYTLRDRDTGEVLKYGETTQGRGRYSQRYLDENNAEMVFEANGTKAEMHRWQHEKIVEHRRTNNGERPRLNRSDY